MVIHANPPQFQLVVCRLGKKILKDKHLVAYWAWELESIPKIWKHALNFVDEIVVPSAFLAQINALLLFLIPSPHQFFAKNGTLWTA